MTGINIYDTNGLNISSVNFKIMDTIFNQHLLLSMNFGESDEKSSIIDFSANFLRKGAHPTYRLIMESLKLPPDQLSIEASLAKKIADNTFHKANFVIDPLRSRLCFFVPKDGDFYVLDFIQLPGDKCEEVEHYLTDKKQSGKLDYIFITPIVRYAL